MSGRPLVVESFRLDVEQEAPFSAFYHHEFLPAVLGDAGGVRGTWRYQEHQVTGSLRYYRKQFLTIHECNARGDAEALIEVLRRRTADGAMGAWARSITEAEPPCPYVERWAHPRVPRDGIFGSRPFFMVSVELRPGREQAFHDWYEAEYLPRNVADVPGWVGCRRYSSVGRTPARHHAIYEAADLHGLDESLEMMRAPFRLKENMSWKKWDTGGDPAITWEDAAMFKPVYRNP
jgi:hypothetical protein